MSSDPVRRVAQPIQHLIVVELQEMAHHAIGVFAVIAAGQPGQPTARGAEVKFGEELVNVMRMGRIGVPEALRDRAERLDDCLGPRPPLDQVTPPDRAPWPGSACRA